MKSKTRLKRVIRESVRVARRRMLREDLQVKSQEFSDEMDVFLQALDQEEVSSDAAQEVLNKFNELINSIKSKSEELKTNLD
tara:strand:+ start:1233 stop:1478 length:246 start_codon:yes stop_codon:yes gene_type:complete